ncbi:MAG: alanine racemase [Planctomycetes bacterium]|nr:alanine racemase [Planctomycetota bacterium]
MEPHRAWAEVDLGALTHNLRQVRAAAGAGVRVLLVVKADGYGLGAVHLARHALRAGVGALGVGTAAEALELRAAGIRAPILILGTVVEPELAPCLQEEIHLGLHEVEAIPRLEELAERLCVRAHIHLNLDTGMGRLGLRPERLGSALEALDRAGHVHLAGLMTHIADPRGWSPATQGQVQELERACRSVRARGPWTGWVHAYNSATLFSAPGPFGDTVRVGLGALGGLELPGAGAPRLRPVFSLHSQVAMLKEVPVGSPIGYGSDWVARVPSRIATVPLGYADGLPWALSNRGQALVRGQRAPLVGRISMDYTTVDVTGIEGVNPGERVTFVGRSGAEELTVGEVARVAGTIPYELTCGLGSRVQRVLLPDREPTLPAQTPGRVPSSPQVDAPSTARPSAAPPRP